VLDYLPKKQSRSVMPTERLQEFSGHPANLDAEILLIAETDGASKFGMPDRCNPLMLGVRVTLSRLDARNG